VFRSVPNLQDLCFKSKGTRGTMWIKVNMYIGWAEHSSVHTHMTYASIPIVHLPASFNMAYACAANTG